MTDCNSPVGGDGGFSDGLPGSGVDFIHSTDTTPPAGVAPTAADYFDVATAGTVAADLDGDGHSDLFFPQMNGQNRLYWGRGNGSFEPAGDGVHSRPDQVDQLASAADFDGDGRLDLLIAGVDTIGLLRGGSDRSFEDATSASGLQGPPGLSGASAWADIDSDGDLDLFVGGYLTDFDLDGGSVVDTVTDGLWRNDGGFFTDITAELPYDDGIGGATLHAAWWDLDGDNDPDLLKLNDFSAYDRYSYLLENRDGTWIDRIEEAGLVGLDYPMGALITDLDEDELEDLWVSNIGTLRAYRRLDTWSFVDVSLSWGADLPSETPWQSWSVLALDPDGDGRNGVFITYGPLTGGSGSHGFEADQPDRYLAPAGEGFSERSEVLGDIQDQNSRGAAIADFNEDGVPDLVVGHVDGAPSLLLGRCTVASRLVVRLFDPLSANRFGVGARVTVTAGGRSATRTVAAGGQGSFSGSGPELFFGLGAADQITELTVQWPDGETTSFENLCSHCTVSIERTVEQ